MTAGRDELHALAGDRSKTWWLLSRCLLDRPEPPLLNDLQAVFGALNVPEGDADRDVLVIRDCLRDLVSPTTLERLLIEFTRLFRGIEQGYGPPPPFESLHRGGQWMGDEVLAIRRCYANAGFGEIEPAAGPADHLGIELRFLALLCYREMEARHAGDLAGVSQRLAEQRAFLDEHLLVWLPGYVALIEREAREPFYGALARLTLAFARDDRRTLDVLEADVLAA
jgi:TorA maturation chaperone TorD